jgi:hypothetical protein
MKNLEQQLSEVLAESDRVAAELNRELFLIGRANAAIGYLRGIREDTARRIERLMIQRAAEGLAAPEPEKPDKEERLASSFGRYDPNWPQ